MGTQICVLIVEDSEDDTALVLRELKRGGYDPTYERVETDNAMRAALDNQTWDIIICDYCMPQFDMPAALEILQKRELDLPFILVSGTVGEETAVKAMKAGAHDYIMKDRLARLVPAIERELREAKKRRYIKQAEGAIQALVKSTVGTTGQDFFDKVVSNMCEWLGTDCACICQIVDGDKLKALSSLFDKKFSCNCTCALSGTACEVVIKEGYIVYDEGLSGLFVESCKLLAEMKPVGYVGTLLRDKKENPIGILWTASRHKLSLPPRTTEVMDIIAAKAASEIEHMQAEEQIMASLKEKEVLLKEVHHRVKNNLQVISSLLNLQSKHIKDKKALNMFRESQNRVKSMALAHEELYQSKDMARIDFKEYVRNLINYLFRSYGVNSDIIMARIKVKNIFLDVDMAIPCGLIINELVSNSLKHAFPAAYAACAVEKPGGNVYREPGRAEGEISINFYSNNNKHTLIVSDNGVSFPEDIDFRKTKSLGLQLVSTLTHQLGGTIKLDESSGTEFKIMFEK